MAECEVNISKDVGNKLILVRDRYKFIKGLGRGSYGEVWLVSPLESSTGSKSIPRRCVVKRVSIEGSNDAKSELVAAEREAQLLSSLKHPNIVEYIESFVSRDHYLNIIMAFCEGGDLYTKLKYRKKKLLEEEQITEWFIQITLALQYMHDRSILHRDLKTQNIFLTKSEIVKVGDLGIAKLLDNNGADLATTVIGTPYYMSPEIFSNQPYGQKSDIWALGCCVYEMATLEHAFKAGDISTLVMKIVRGETPTLPSSNSYSEPLIELINSMLNKNAANRPTAEQILRNPYMKNHISRLIDKRRKCSQSYKPIGASPLAVSLDSNDRHSMPPTPKPRISQVTNNEESSNAKPLSSTPPMSQSRMRRLREKSASAKYNEVERLPLPNLKIKVPQQANVPCAINNDFITKIRQNDTLARFKREVSSADSNNGERGNLSARERRREQNKKSMTKSKDDHDNYQPVTPPVYDRSISNDSQIDTVEEERKERLDMDNLLHHLDATLRLPASSSSISASAEVVPDSFDRTMISTVNIVGLCNVLKDHCLKQMTNEQLNEVLDLLNQVSETDIKARMIEILGQDVYERCGSQIHGLKFYKSSLFTKD